MNPQLTQDIKDWQLKTDQVLENLFSSAINKSESIKLDPIIGMLNEARTLLLRTTL